MKTKKNNNFFTYFSKNLSSFYLICIAIYGFNLIGCRPQKSTENRLQALAITDTYNDYTWFSSDKGVLFQKTFADGMSCFYVKHDEKNNGESAQFYNGTWTVYGQDFSLRPVQKVPESVYKHVMKYAYYYEHPDTHSCIQGKDYSPLLAIAKRDPNGVVGQDMMQPWTNWFLTSALLRVENIQECVKQSLMSAHSVGFSASPAKKPPSDKFQEFKHIKESEAKRIEALSSADKSIRDANICPKYEEAIKLP